MGRRAKAKREAEKSVGKSVEAKPRLRSKPNYALLALSGLGVVLTGYLTWTAWNGDSVRGCAVGSACDVVLTSRWATLFGFPTAFWGLVTYGALAVTSFVRSEERHWMTAWSIALFGLLYSVYLTTVSLTILDAACPYCLTSLALMASVFVLTTWQRPAGIPNFSWFQSLRWRVPIGLAAVLVLHLHYTGFIGETPSAEDPMARALAEHLSQTGATFYGAYWCPHCMQQKEMFGRSANRLPYIECTPDGQSAPQSNECQNANIQSYPTWVINGQRHEEVMNFKRLADLSGFEDTIP